MQEVKSREKKDPGTLTFTHVHPRTLFESKVDLPNNDFRLQPRGRTVMVSGRENPMEKG